MLTNMFMNKIKIFYIATGLRGWSYVRNFWFRNIKNCSLAISEIYISLKLETALQDGNARYILGFNGKPIISLLYKSYYFFLHGQYKNAILNINEFLNHYPSHQEGHYLKYKCITALNSSNEYLFLCKNFLLSRPKTWQYISDSIKCHEFYKLENLYKKSVKKHIIKEDDTRILNFIVKAAIQTKNYNKAEIIYNKIIELNSKNGYITKEKHINNKNALNALSQLAKIAKQNNIKLFILSGTLLGIIRDNRLIKNDKDLDTGVMAISDFKSLKMEVLKSGFFTLLKQRTQHTIRIKHINGTPIDIFLHWKQKNKIFHGGAKAIWENTNFNLREITFHGINLLIPQDYNKYLTENYGDWRAKKIIFDSIFDTPNSKIVSICEMRIHCLQKISENIISNKYLSNYYYEKLKGLGTCHD